jgi:hypothetical protein
MLKIYKEFVMKMDIFIKNGVIKQREEVEQTIFKKNFDLDYRNDLPGPYYDKSNNHCHVWKPMSLIKNFKGEQNQSELKYRKHTGEIPTRGLYCSICHLRLKGKGYDLKKVLEVPVQPDFKKRKCEEDLSKMLKCVKITKRDTTILWDRLYILIQKSHISKYRRLYDSLVDVKKQKDKIIGKWQSFAKKLTEPYVYYQINGLESIPMKLSEMTPFQRFKYHNPNYRKTTSFIININSKFDTNYVTIG